MMLGLILISATFFAGISCSHDAVSSTAWHLASLLRQDAISMALPDRSFLRTTASTTMTTQSRQIEKGQSGKGKKPAKKPSQDSDYYSQYDYGYSYGYGDGNGNGDGDSSKSAACNFRESCMDYFTILYLTELLFGQSQSDELLGLDLGLNLLQILNLNINLDLLGSGNNELSVYYNFCNMGSCYRSAMDALESKATMDPYLREDIAMGAKASQLEYIAGYLNQTQPENKLNAVFREADAILTSQLSEQGLAVKRAVSSRGGCKGLRYGYIPDSSL